MRLKSRKFESQKLKVQDTKEMIYMIDSDIQGESLIENE